MLSFFTLIQHIILSLSLSRLTEVWVSNNHFCLIYYPSVKQKGKIIKRKRR